MPANVVKTPAGERAWKKAKGIVRSQYPDLSEDGDRFWATVMTVYQSICKSPKYACEPKEDTRVEGMARDVLGASIVAFVRKAGGEAREQDILRALRPAKRKAIKHAIDGLVRRKVLADAWDEYEGDTVLRLARGESVDEGVGDTKGITLTTIKSKSGPTYKIGISAKFGRVMVVGETLPVHIGIDRVDGRLAMDILPPGKVHRVNSSKPVTSSMMRKLEKSVLARLVSLDENAQDAASEPRVDESMGELLGRLEGLTGEPTP